MESAKYEKRLRSPSAEDLKRRVRPTRTESSTRTSVFDQSRLDMESRLCREVDNPEERTRTSVFDRSRMGSIYNPEAGKVWRVKSREAGVGKSENMAGKCVDGSLIIGTHVLKLTESTEDKPAERTRCRLEGG